MAKKSSASKFPVNPELEAAVIARAEEDAPRLMYADWLDDHGDPDRAAFIRTQVALWDKNPADADYVELLNREEELESLEVPQRLAPPLSDNFLVRGTVRTEDSEVHRGFPLFSLHALPAGEFRDMLPHIYGKTTIRGFHPGEEEVQHLAADDFRDGVQALCFNANGPQSYDHDFALYYFFEAPFGASVQWLELGSLGQATAAALAHRNCALRPRRVGMCFRRCTAVEIKRVLLSKALSTVHHIEAEFGQNWDTASALSRPRELHTLVVRDSPAEVIPAFAGGGRYPALARLVFQNTPLRGAGIRALADAKCPRLCALEFHECDLQNRDVVALADSALFARLRVLEFSSERIGDQAIRAVAASASAKSLQSLSLRGSNPVVPGLRAIATGFPDLLAFRARDTRSELNISDVTRFVSELTCDRLHVLDVDFSLSDTGAIALAKNPAIASLRTLSFDDGSVRGGLSERGLAALFTSPYLSNLVVLRLRSWWVSKVAPLLRDRAVLPNLRHLEVFLKGDTRRRLLAARPELSIRNVSDRRTAP